MSIRNYFRSKRQLIADNAELSALVAKQTEEIAEVRRDAKERVEEERQSLVLAHRAMNTQRRLRIAAEERMEAVVEALQKLREEIAQLERGDRPTFGMARYHDRPLVWQTADAIREDAAHVRREDV